MQIVASADSGLRPRVVGAVAVGGAIGATARWGSNELVASVTNATTDPTVAAAFPWATFAVNVVGALLVAVATANIERGTARWAFTVTGVLGGFTTMSAFGVELNELVDADRTDTAALYLGATFAIAAGAFLLAERVAKPPRFGHES
ncbi:MAG: CrcB family protein [Ilumatobacter sp.]